MSSTVAAVPAETSQRFIGGFILLSVVSGVSIGMGKVVTTLFAISLGADGLQVGLISALESVGMVLVTVPAGFVIARYGPRTIYFTASLGPMLVNLILPWIGVWYGLALARGAIGLCIPFRIVSMNSAFLDQLKHLGPGKAGWYRGSLTFGIAMLGPAVATFFTRHLGHLAAFLFVALLFGVMAAFSLSFFPEKRESVIPAKAGIQEHPHGNSSNSKLNHLDSRFRGNDEGAGVRREVASLLRNRDISESCLIEFVSSSTNATFSTFIILVALSIPTLTEADGVHVMLFQGGMSVLALFFAGSLLQRLDKGRAYAMGLVLAVVALAVLGLGHSFSALAVGAVLLSAAGALVHLVNMLLLSRQEGEKSKISGLYNLASMLGSSSGAILGGVLSKFVPVQQIYLWWIPLLLTAGAVVHFGMRRS